MERGVVRTLMVGVTLVGLGTLLQGSPPVFAKSLPSSRESAVSETAGRYQIVVNPNLPKDTFLLDTATGRVWLRTKFTDLKGEPTVWLVMDRLDSTDDMKNWLREFIAMWATEPRDPGAKGLEIPELRVKTPELRLESPEPGLTSPESTDFPSEWLRRFKLQ